MEKVCFLTTYADNRSEKREKTVDNHRVNLVIFILCVWSVGNHVMNGICANTHEEDSLY